MPSARYEATTSLWNLACSLRAIRETWESLFGVVAKRTGFDRPRVVVPGNPRGRLRTMMEERRPVYESLAALTVPADDLVPDEVADELVKRLEDR